MLNCKAEDKSVDGANDGKVKDTAVLSAVNTTAKETAQNSRSVAASDKESTGYQDGDIPSKNATPAASDISGGQVGAGNQIQRTLSEDLALGDEHNFKAIYSEDEDDEDHITVTVSNTVNSDSWVYANSGLGFPHLQEGQVQEVHEEKELDDDATDLDNLTGQEINFAEEDGSAWA